jgi:predicted PurR-regulated permease PerM
MLLILAGVIGGLIAFGLLGIFVSPTVLAVAYWISGRSARAAGPSLHARFR